MRISMEELAEKLLDATNRIQQLESQTELLAIQHKEDMDKINARMEKIIKCL
jgi:hypothetical protein